MTRVIFLALLGACASGVQIDGPSGGGTTDGAADDTSEDIGGLPDTGDTDEGGGDTTDGCSDLYDRSVVQEFEIEISEDEWQEIENDYSRGEKDYHPIVFRYGDEVVEDAMIRLKGNPYFSWFTEKKQFVIVVSDPDGKLPKHDFVGWVLQIPETESVATTLDRIFRSSYDFNTTKKGRLMPVKTVGEALENVPAKAFKEADVWVKTKTPVLMLKTDNEIPKE